MKVIYKPKGRAGEYSEYALNIGSGCVHHCAYCYVPGITRQSPEDFRREFIVKKDLFKRLESDLQFMQKNKIKSPVLLCFANDPYQNELAAVTTTHCIHLFNQYNQNFQILTKAGVYAAKFFNSYKLGDMFACSLTFLNKEDSLRVEPDAALPESRIEALRMANHLGIYTWVSFEPVLDGHQTVELFHLTKDFVDFYKVGKVSNFPSKIKNWGNFGRHMLALFQKHGKGYMIKKDLLECM